MLDGIFGSGEKEELREELEEKEGEIEELEEKIREKEEELEEAREDRKEAVRRMEKERDRAKEAVTEKQEVDRELNEAEHKIESLEDRIEKLKEEREERREGRETRDLTRSETLFLIKELESVEVDGSYLVTNYIREAEKGAEIEEFLRGLDSETGFIHVQDRFDVVNCVIVPPLPVEEEFYRDNEFRLEDLLGLMRSEADMGFLSLHAGKSAVGILHGPEFENFEIVSGEVKEKHSKGGFSQGRFERGRDEQIRNHLEDVLDLFEDLRDGIDYLILDGNKRMISEVRDDVSSDFTVIERSLDIGSVGGKEKEDYVEKIWGSRLYLI